MSKKAIDLLSSAKIIEDIISYAKLQGTENSPEWKKVIDWHKSQQIELIKKVVEMTRKMERGTKNYSSSHEAILNSDKDYGYNQALEDIISKLQEAI